MTLTAFWIAAMNHAKKELHMDVDLIGIRFILRRRRFYNSVKIACLPGKWLYREGALIPTASAISPTLTAS